MSRVQRVMQFKSTTEGSFVVTVEAGSLFWFSPLPVWMPPAPNGVTMTENDREASERMAEYLRSPQARLLPCLFVCLPSPVKHRVGTGDTTRLGWVPRSGAGDWGDRRVGLPRTGNPSVGAGSPARSCAAVAQTVTIPQGFAALPRVQCRWPLQPLLTGSLMKTPGAENSGGASSLVKGRHLFNTLSNMTRGALSTRPPIDCIYICILSSKHSL